MRAPFILLCVSALCVALAGCADDAPEESAASDQPMSNGSTAMCLEGAEDCDDTPTMETVEDPYAVGT